MSGTTVTYHYKKRVVYFLVRTKRIWRALIVAMTCQFLHLKLTSIQGIHSGFCRMDLSLFTAWVEIVCEIRDTLRQRTRQILSLYSRNLRLVAVNGMAKLPQRNATVSGIATHRGFARQFEKRGYVSKPEYEKLYADTSSVHLD